MLDYYILVTEEGKNSIQLFTLEIPCFPEDKNGPVQGKLAKETGLPV